MKTRVNLTDSVKVVENEDGSKSLVFEKFSDFKKMLEPAKISAISESDYNNLIVSKANQQAALEAQKKAYAGTLDGWHPLFWASKLHFFLTSVPFYNFPYTFGFLFAIGIYDRALKQGPSFAKDYRALLADTGSMNTEDVAQKHLGVDLTKEGYWKDAVNRVMADIEPFVRLAEGVE